MDSWKEIAAYLERDVSTGSAYAFRSELDTWASGTETVAHPRLLRLKRA